MRKPISEIKRELVLYFGRDYLKGRSGREMLLMHDLLEVCQRLRILFLRQLEECAFEDDVRGELHFDTNALHMVLLAPLLRLEMDDPEEEYSVEELEFVLHMAHTGRAGREEAELLWKLLLTRALTRSERRSQWEIVCGLLDEMNMGPVFD